MTRKDIEILAPAGSREALAAALKAGADAVYFGAGKLNMRARSSGAFSLGDLREIAGRAADSGARAYLALNAVLFDEDLEELRRAADAAKKAGISAIIASDAAVIEYARSIGLSVHLSTQANVSNLEALRFWARYADTVVLARELSLEQIGAVFRAVEGQSIRGPSGGLVRIEAFVHGALCMATSGKCYLSLHRYGASANRGECNQNCRRSYLLRDPVDGSELLREEDYFLSPRDLKTIGFLDEVLASGIRSLKIEGRARQADYVKTTVECYREAVEAVLDGSFGPERVADWDKRLARVFNRGFWDGWYLGAKIGERTGEYGSEATVRKTLVGECVNYYAKAGIGEFRLDAAPVPRGASLLATGPTTGALEFVLDEPRVDGEPVERAEKGSVFTAAVPERVRKGDRLYVLEEA